MMRGARLRAAIAACALAAMSCAGDKAVAVTSAYPTTQTFDRACSVLWPELLTAIDRAGFRLMQHDRDGWIATFNWPAPQLPVGYPREMNFNRLAIGEDGSWQDASGLRVDSAVLVLTPRKPGCEAALRVTYRSEQGGFWRPKPAKPVSSGLFESVILSESVSALARKSPRGRRPS
jgi:hypothetical protein